MTATRDPWQVHHFNVTPRRPFSLERTAHWFVRFSQLLDRWEEGRYSRLLLAGSRPLLLSISQTGPPSRAELTIEVRGAGARGPRADEATRRLLDSLGVSVDIRPFYRALGNDPLLGPTFSRFRGLRVAGWPGLFEAMVSAILSQQVNLRLSYDIRDEIARTFGLRARFDGTTFQAFPTAARLAGESVRTLRSFRLSRVKAEAIVGVAEKVASGKLDETELASLPDAEVIERLVALRGVGRWTAETVLLRGLRRIDAFPAGDLGVVKYLAQGLLERKSKVPEAEMRRFAERWRPFRGLALVYAYAELARRAGRSPKRDKTRG